MLDSIRAAFLVAPKIAIPLTTNWSTTPSARGPSGPTTVSAIPFSRTILTSDSISAGLTSMLWAIWAVPALPGATKISSTFGLWASFQTRVCSLPPPPTTNIFRVRLLISLFLSTSPHQCNLSNIFPVIASPFRQISRPHCHCETIPPQAEGEAICVVGSNNPQLSIQVVPVPVYRINEVHLILPRASFDLLLPDDSAFDIAA